MSIEDYDIWLAKRGRACSKYYWQLWDTLCVKLRTHNLCMIFQRWTEDQTLCTLFSLFFSTYICTSIKICKSRQFATVCTHVQIVDRPRLQCCPLSECGVSEYVLGWWCLHTHTHTHTHTHVIAFDRGRAMDDVCVLLYKPLFLRTVIFAFLTRCGNSRVVNFAIFLMLSLL